MEYTEATEAEIREVEQRARDRGITVTELGRRTGIRSVKEYTRRARRALPGRMARQAMAGLQG